MKTKIIQEHVNLYRDMLKKNVGKSLNLPNKNVVMEKYSKIFHI
jgi:hypothetical protein